MKIKNEWYKKKHKLHEPIFPIDMEKEHILDFKLKWGIITKLAKDNSVIKIKYFYNYDAFRVYRELCYLSWKLQISLEN